MERFFSLDHLTTEQLHDLYRDAYKVGKLLVEYDKPGEQEYYTVNLPENEILKDISSEGYNYLVFHEDFEGYPDSVTVAFSMTGHPFTTVYIDMDNARLDWFAKKYNLTQWWQMEGSERKHYPFSEFYTREPMKRHLWN
ncbi:hypothetical protein F050043D4_47710 [Bacteroides thetaiotaomicron]|uniref:hypothetical protein n=1 Tax=Bacteroides thetaiotaomicron TaxID=818 RepID=UPI0034B3FB90